MGRCHHSIVVKASVGQARNVIKDFHDFSWFPNVIKKTEPLGHTCGAEIGARRILNDTFPESLIEFNEGEYLFRYLIDEARGPLRPRRWNTASASSSFRP